MKERGLICKDDEVSAILDGRKTVFRRPVTSIGRFGRIVGEGSRGYSIACQDTKGVVHDIAYHEACDRGPFGVPGDRLWVKEIHKLSIAHHCALDSCDCDDVLVEYEAGGEPLVVDGDKVPGSWSLPVRYEKRGIGTAGPKHAALGLPHPARVGLGAHRAAPRHHRG